VRFARTGVDGGAAASAASLQIWVVPDPIV
jgi:hypothetical protein